MKTSSLLSFLVLIFPMLAMATDRCQQSDPDDPRVNLVLKNTWLDHESFVGRFVLSNLKMTHTLAVAGFKDEQGFSVSSSSLGSIQFKDLNGRWVDLLELPGTFLAPTDRLLIKPGTSEEFITRLMTREVADLSGSYFRVLIRLSSPKICIVSQPFQPLPLRNSVTNFESIQP